MGTMYAVINAPRDGSVLCASLVRRNADGGYTAVKLGELRRDGRGQANLAYSFDPRSIDGLALEEYRVIAIAARSPAGRCSVVLSGNVNGSREVDWNGMQAAVCAACGNTRPQTDVPARPGEGPSGAQTPVLPPAETPASPGEGPVEAPTPSLPADTPAQPDEGPVDAPMPSVPPETEPPFSGGDQPAFDLPEELPLPNAFAPAERTAAEVLGLDASVRWPGVSEQVRAYFSQPPETLTPDDGYTYVYAPMPAGSGYDRVEVGLKAENGVPVSVAYALPSRYTPEPPQGLEDYSWRGGSNDGWWVIETDNYTGERIL